MDILSRICILFCNQNLNIIFMNIHEKVANEILELRLQKKISQTQLSRLTGLSLVTVNKAERFGKMHLKTYQIIMKTLNELP